jgi:hypothetical protein
MTRYIKLLSFFIALAWGFSTGVFGQHYLGVRGGYGGGLGRFDSRNQYEMRLWTGAPSAGISWKYYSSQPVVGALQADLQWITKGFRRVHLTLDPEGNEVVDSTYTRTLNAVELPFFWHIHFYAMQRRMRIYLNLGVYASYFYDSYEYQQGRSLGEGVEVGRPYELKPMRDNMFEYGLAGGFGFSYLFNRFEVFLEARYNFGYSDIMKSPGKYPGSNFQRTPIDMVNLSAGLYYRLGKGGILAPPPGSNRSGETWSIPARRTTER